jgi:hypothetical protein
MISSIGIIEDAKALEYEANEVEEQGRHLDSVRLMERALLLRLHVNPVDEAEACRAAERLVVKCNATAVGCFKEDQYGIATDLLQNAMRMTDEGADPLGRNPAKRRALRGTTLNNLACMERRRGRLPAALEFIEAAIATASSQSPATYLNLSAILAQMGNSNQAVSAAKQAIVLLESGSPERQSLIAIAYHNLATALEPVDIVEAIGTFETALRLSLQTLGRDSATTHSIEQNLKRLRRKGPGGEGRSTQVVSSLPPIHGMRGSSRGGRGIDAPRPLTEGGLGKGLLSSLPTHIPTINSPRLAKLPMTAGSKLKGFSLHKPAPPNTASTTNSKHVSGNRSVSNSGVGDSRRPSTINGGPRPPGGAANRRVSAASGNLPARPRVGQAVFSASDMAKGEDVLTYMCSRLDALLEEEHEFDTQFAAATRIQCMCRVFRARARTHERRRARLQLKDIQQTRQIVGARTIQRFLGRLVVLRHDQDRRAQAEVLRKQKENGAAITIQRQSRIWLARNEANRRRNFEKNHSKAVRVLQCWFRKTLATKTVARMKRVQKKLTTAALLSERRKSAATNIQRVWRTVLSSQITVAARGERCAATEREVLSRRVAMAVTIQRCWRGYLDRRVANQRKAHRAFRASRVKHAEKERAATVALQALARGIIARKSVTPLLEARRVAAQEAASATRTGAATTIQKIIRRSLARIWASKLIAARARVIQREQHTYIATMCQRIGRALDGRKQVGSLRYQAQNSELFSLCAEEAAGRREMGADERTARCGADMRAAFTALKQELAVHIARKLRADSHKLMTQARQKQEEEGAKARAAAEAERLRREEEAARVQAEYDAKIAWEIERQNERKAAFTKTKVDAATDVLGEIADLYNAAKEEWYYDSIEAVKQLPPPPPQEETMSAQEEADAERLVAKYLHDVQPREPRFKDEPTISTAPLSEFSQKLAAAAAEQKVVDAKKRNTAATHIQRIARGIADRQHHRTISTLRDQYIDARVDSERLPEDTNPLVPAPPRGEKKPMGARRSRAAIPDNVGATLHLAGSYSELERVMGSVVGYDSARTNKTGRAAKALEAAVLAKVSEIHAMHKRDSKYATASQNIEGMMKIVEAKRVRKEKLIASQQRRANIEKEQRESTLVACLLAQCSVRVVRNKALSRIEGGIRIINAKRALAIKRADAEESRAALRVLEDEVFAAQNAAASIIQKNLTAVSAAKREVAQRRSDATSRNAVDPNASTTSQDLETESAAGLIQRNYRGAVARRRVSSLTAPAVTTTNTSDPNASTASQDLEAEAAACVIQRSFRTSQACRGASARRDELADRRSKIKERDDVEDAAARTLQGAKKILAAKTRKTQLRAETANKWEERRRLAADEDEADDVERFNAAAGEYETIAAAEEDEYEYEL